MDLPVKVETVGTPVRTLVGVEAIPKRIRSLTTLSSPDYIDLFTLPTSVAPFASAEDWARAILERAPLSRSKARRLWRLMGLRLGPLNSADHIQGWKIAARGDGWIRCETSAWYMSAEALCLQENEEVSVSLSLRYHQPLVARLVWTLVEHPHQLAVPVMLRQAVKVMRAELAETS
jgi:hypothetical protein